MRLNFFLALCFTGEAAFLDFAEGREGPPFADPPYIPNYVEKRPAALCAGGFNVLPSNPAQLQLLGAAVQANNKCSFSDFVTCGTRSETDCGNEIPGSTQKCYWYNNAAEQQSLLGKGSCVMECYSTFTIGIGVGFYFEDMTSIDGTYVDSKNFPGTVDQFTCMQQSFKSPEDCTSTVDSTGHKCTSCRVPLDYYPFRDSPPSDREKLSHWCINDRGLPRLCDFYREPSRTCEGVSVSPPDWPTKQPTTAPTGTATPTKPPTGTATPTKPPTPGTGMPTEGDESNGSASSAASLAAVLAAIAGAVV